MDAGLIEEKTLKDPWGNTYHYKGPSNPESEGDEAEFQLFSAGEDDKPVTADDISSSEVSAGA